MTRPTTLGELKAAGWQSRSVRDEVRANAVQRIAAGESLVANVIGYEDTVIPQLENALLAGHDVIFLGERGQAKTRMIRGLTALLDEWMPIVAGSEINDDPYHPVSRHARELIAHDGDDTTLDWVHRDQRYGEKLATPDTSIADLIGEVDPIRVAEGRYLSDELTIHYGLVPRTNRGLFAINELPDLSERIQVGLLNVLEERDVQIRGFKVRLPLDVLLFASANPEDYTNRGRIITPLKDRFGAQIRTHYPLEVDIELDIAEQEARLPDTDGVSIEVPDFMGEIVATLSHLARDSPHINQRSGVSVRLTVANYETLAASAVRRSLRAGEARAVPRVCDLDALAPSTMGKVEIEVARRRPRRRDHPDAAQGGGARRVPRRHRSGRGPGGGRGFRRRPTGRRCRRRRRRRRLPEAARPSSGFRSVPHGPRLRGRRSRRRAVGGQRHRVRARGPPPVETSQQDSDIRLRRIARHLQAPLLIVVRVIRRDVRWVWGCGRGR